MTAGAAAGPGSAAGPDTGGAGPGRAGGRTGELGRGTSANLVGTAVSAVANLGFTVVVTRGVGRGEAGDLFTATSLFLLLQMTSKLGADTGATYFVARSMALDGGARVRAHLRAAARPVTVATLLAAAVLGGIALSWRQSSTGHTAVFAACLLAFVPAATLSDVALAASRGFGDMRPTVLLDKLLRPAGQLVLVAAAVVAGGGIALPLAWAAPYAVTAALAVRPVRNRLRRLPAAGPQSSASGEFWSFAAPRALASVAQTVMQRLDIVLVAVLRGPADAAVYTAATRFLTLAQMVNLALSQPLQPRLSALLAVGDVAGTARAYRRTTGWLVLLSWPLLLWCAVAGPLFLRVFGPGYSSAAAAGVVVVLAATMLVSTACGTIDMLLIMAGRTSWNLANSTVALAALVAIDLALIPHVGILGAAAGWAAAILVNNLAPLVQVRRLLGIHPFGRATLVAVGATAVSFGAVPLAVLGLAGRTWPALAVATVAAAIVLAACAWPARRLLGLHELAAVLPRR